MRRALLGTCSFPKNPFSKSTTTWAIHRVKYSSSSDPSPPKRRDEQWCLPKIDISFNYRPKDAVNRYTKRTHTCGELRREDCGKHITLMGWLMFRRFGGRIIVLRDGYGSTQVIIPQEKLELIQTLNTLQLESVISVSGIVSVRPLKQQRTDTSTGEVELLADSIVILNRQTEMKLPSYKEFSSSDEELQTKYRYLTMRTELMQKRLRFRANLIDRMRLFMQKMDFIDVETPTLLRRSPGGAREFVVPTHHEGLFYSLAQSPQILKQILMAGGIDRYYQIARCYRNEKSKPERQPEFTQLDIELSFTTREDVMKLIEDCLKYSLELPSDYPSFPCLSYETALKYYGSDKPDTDGFLWIIDFPLFQRNEKGNLESAHHPFTAPLLVEQLYEDPENAVGLSYDLVYKGIEIGGGSIRIHDASLQRYVFEKILNYPVMDIEYLLTALGAGCPPHGGFAVGIDRLVALLVEAKTIREVIAFPKSSDGKDSLSGAPQPLTQDDRSYYHLK